MLRSGWIKRAKVKFFNLKDNLIFKGDIFKDDVIEMIFIGIGLHGEFYAEGVTYNRYFF
jgi:hypothetical protein